MRCRGGSTAGAPKPGHARVSQQRLDTIRPSPENAKPYRPVDKTDPEVIELAESIRRYGVQEPLVVTTDG